MSQTSISSDIQAAVEERDAQFFENCCERFSPDPNGFIVNDFVNQTQLNVLHLLSGFESTDFVLRLITKWLSIEGVDINHQGMIDGNNGMTAAHIATLNNNTKTLRLLIASECDLFICDSHGKNIKDYADEDSSPEVLALIDEAINDFIQHSRFASKPVEQDASILSPIHSENEDDDATPRANKNSSRHFVELEADFKLPFSGRKKKENSQTEPEIVIHKDQEIEFLEKRTPGSSFLIEEQCKMSEAGSQNSVADSSMESAIDEFILKMTNTQLREHFQGNGHTPGPINEFTRKAYEKKANKELKTTPKTTPKGVEKKASSTPSYKKNAYDVLMRKYRLDYNDIFQRKFDFREAIRLEEIMAAEFQDSASLFSDNCQTPSKPEMTYFVYLLLDPEITKNLPARANLNFENMLFGAQNATLDSLDPSLFVAFIKAIFYAGKGKNNRPYQHFYDAIAAYAAKKKKNSPAMPRSGIREPKGGAETAKTERILDIWSKKRGPVSLHCFHGISADEAFAREYIIIETLGLQNLTNRISGNSRIKQKLPARQRQILGTYLLYKAFIMLLLNGERQIKSTNKFKL